MRVDDCIMGWGRGLGEARSAGGGGRQSRRRKAEKVKADFL